ncbi:MAG: HAMP domain-containing histidine kinase [Melioribacteraceae bacterium]|nr:HAMP domain-containing histidine kinase [Melioribacteraceae bacterium]
MKNYTFHKILGKYFLPISFSLFLAWSLILFLLFLWNSKTLSNSEDIDRMLIIHLSIWIIGILFSLPNIFLLLKQKKDIESLNLSTSNFATLFNSITSPAFIFSKKSGIITHTNQFAKEHFEIHKNEKNHIEIEALKHLTNELKKHSNSVITNMKTEHSCKDSAGEEILYEAVLNDIIINNSYSTLIVLNNKKESSKDLQEMNKYIEDLHAKEDALEDNAFELIQLNIKLEESEDNLREVNANKDKFFSIVAHDLKSPFVGLLGISEMLDTDYDDFDEKEKRELIRSLYDISKNTFELLEGLLEWARAKQGRMDYNPEKFNLFQVADSLANLLKANAFKKEITLHNSVDINAMVYGDRDMVATVLRNLLANAIKFTPQNGIININAKIENNLMEVSVRDSGIGMSQESIEKLFRIDVNHTTLGTNDEKGTGLGLILCKELIEKHGTNIWVESELGNGSLFVFTLPLEGVSE